MLKYMPRGKKKVCFSVLYHTTIRQIFILERRRQYNRNTNNVVNSSVNNLKPTNPQDFVVRKVPDLGKYWIIHFL